MNLSQRASISFKQALLYCCLLITLLFLVFPVYYMVITSLKTPGEAYRLPPTLWPEHLTLEAYPFMFQAWGYWQTLANTVIVAGLSAQYCAVSRERAPLRPKTIEKKNAAETLLKRCKNYDAPGAHALGGKIPMLMFLLEYANS